VATRDSEATRQRLIEAARREFGEFGIAGARVDRIAGSAEANKAQIYHYFGSKDELFDAVWASIVKKVVVDMPVDTHDLPGYAVRLADVYAANPEIQRLVTWKRLERGQDPPHAFAAERTLPVIDAIVLFGLILSIAAMWQTHSPDFLSVVGVSDPKRRREIVREAVERLLVL
jgi:AcrR family transcriptional regulator